MVASVILHLKQLDFISIIVPAGIREFLCKLCNYKGVTQSDLNRHMKSQIHMMKMQNECRLCGEGYLSLKCFYLKSDSVTVTLLQHALKTL